MSTHPSRYAGPVMVTTGITFHGQPIAPQIDAYTYLEMEIGWSEILLAAATYGCLSRNRPWGPWWDTPWSEMEIYSSLNTAARIADSFLNLDVETDSAGERRLYPSLWLQHCMERHGRIQGSYSTGMTFAQLMCRRLGVDATCDIDMLYPKDGRHGGHGRGQEADLYGSNPSTRPEEWIIEAKGSLATCLADMLDTRKEGAGQLDAARTRTKCKPWTEDHFQALVATAGKPYVAALVDVGQPTISGITLTSDLKKRLGATPEIPSAWQQASFAQRMGFGLMLREVGQARFLHYEALDVWVGLAAPILQRVHAELEYADGLAGAKTDITVREVVTAVDNQFIGSAESDGADWLQLQSDNAAGPDSPIVELSMDNQGRIVALGSSWVPSSSQPPRVAD